MGDGSSKVNDRVENGQEFKLISPIDAALAVDNAGKEELVREQKMAAQQQKEGKVRSGITDEFGALLVTGLSENHNFPKVGGQRQDTRIPPDEDLAYGENEKESAWSSHAKKSVESMAILEDGTVQYRYEVGTTEELHPNGEREVTFPDGSVHLTFPDGTSLLKHANGNQEKFDQHGNSEWLKKQRPDGGHVVTDQKGRLIEVVGAGGNYHTTCEYGDDGNLTRIGGSFGVWTRAESWDGRTYWENRATLERFDGRMTVDKDGGVHQMPSDPNAEARIWKLDGVKITTIRSKDNTDANDPELEKSRLDEQAGSKITDLEARTRFQTDMREFEERAAKQGMSKKEIAETYKQIRRLLDTPGEQPVSEADRIKLAQEVMHMASHPTECDQGQHNTCNVTTVESRTYTRNPAAAARLVADVATTGEYKTADGSVIKIDGNNLQQDFEAQCSFGNSDRNYASQVFQVTAANIHWQRQSENPHDKPGMLTRLGHILGLADVNKVEKGSIRYEQHVSVPGMNPPDTGERLVDYSRNPPQVVVGNNGQPLDTPWLHCSDLTDISNEITGKHETDMVIQNEDLASEDSTIKVGSELDLKYALAKAKFEGRLPIIIMVNAGKEPFFLDSGGGAAGGSGSWHVVNITDFDIASELVSIDNQWGEDMDRLTGDRRVSAADLYRATSD